MKTICFLLITSLTMSAYAQTWIKTYDHNNGNTDVASKIIETNNNHFIVAGQTTIPSIWMWGFNGFIIALDFNGDTLWTKTLGSSANDFLTDVIENNNNELIFTGSRYYFPANSPQLWIIKLQLNANGTQIISTSEKYFGGNDKDDGGTKIIQNPDGTYFVTGNTESYGTQQGGSDAWLLKLNSNLDTIWTKTYDFGYAEEAKSIIPFNSGNYLMLVNSTTGQMGFPPFYTNFAKVLLINSSGNVLKTLTFNNDTINYFINARPTSDGGAILIGSTGVNDNSVPYGGRNIFIVKLNANADTVWTKIYGGYGKYDGGLDIIQDNDGTYYAACYTQTQYVDSVDNWYLMRLDAQGNIIYSNCLIHKKDNDDPVSILKASDGTLVIAGHINANSNPGQSWDLGNSDICVAKLDTNFVTGIQEQVLNKLSFTIYPNPFTAQATLHTDQILENATLRIYNIYSQKVKEITNIYGQTITLQRNNLPSGLYFVQLLHDNNVITNAKLIILTE
ncbi:MAG: T9SS type A sorting domain-containing protein [Candidatus Kapaibacteriota bacterium]